MAEGILVRKSNVVCRYFLSATCKDGERCHFSHDRTLCIPDSVCRYYLRGVCAFGEKCWYDHISLSELNSTKLNSGSENLLVDDSKQSAYRNLVCSNSENQNPNAEISASAIKFRSTSTPRNWINAPEFVPSHIKSYADTLKVNYNNQISQPNFKEICPLFAEGDCHLFECPWIHGNMCDLCQKACLHPFDEEARKLHIEECEKKLEQDMEFSFAIQRSMEKTCGICMEVVLEKEPVSERKFGILEKCNHVYCLSCIRKWRRSKRHESDHHIEMELDPVTRACPECRILSHFVIPSDYFVSTQEEKQKIISEYKSALSGMHCKYFKKGEGECPFGRSCFYLHATPDGTKVELPLPTRRRRQDQDGVFDFVGAHSLWDYLEARAERSRLDYMEHLSSNTGHVDELSSDTDDTTSNVSDY